MPSKGLGVGSELEAPCSARLIGLTQSGVLALYSVRYTLGVEPRVNSRRESEGHLP